MLSLHHLLQLDDVAFRSEGSSLLVLEGRTTWAVQIDEAAAITSLETIVAPDSRSDLAGTAPVRGTATFGDKIVRVLDPIGLYQAAQKAVHDFWKDADQQTQSTPHVIRENRE